MSGSVFLDLQKAVVRRLESADAFRGITVLQRLKGNIKSDIDAAIAQIGLTAFVFPPLPMVCNPNMAGPYIDRAEIVIRIFEKQVLNQTSQNAFTLVEAILRRLHLWSPDLAGVGKLACDERPVTDRSNEQVLTFDLAFFAPIALPAPTL